MTQVFHHHAREDSVPKRVKISFVIRTYNEAAFIGRLYDALDSQEGVLSENEITLVDSGSTDETVRIAQSRSINLIEIPKATFDYSKALNLGIERSAGDILVILSAHAIPCNSNWLSLMVSHFDDESVAGVYCRQVPWPSAYWREVVRLRRMFGEHPHVFEATHANDVSFSNAASCIRRSAWQERPFNLPAAEDIEWATWAVASGHKIIYEARAPVYHSHNETPRQAARRLIDLEKAADIRLARRRGLLMTGKQGVGAALRDGVEISRYTPATAARLGYAWDSMLRSYWFIRDFGNK